MNGNGIWGLKWQRQDLREVCPKSLRIKEKSLSNQNHWLEKKKSSFIQPFYLKSSQEQHNLLYHTRLASKRRCFVAVWDRRD